MIRRARAGIENDIEIGAAGAPRARPTTGGAQFFGTKALVK